MTRSKQSRRTARLPSSLTLGLLLCAPSLFAAEQATEAPALREPSSAVSPSDPEEAATEDSVPLAPGPEPLRRAPGEASIAVPLELNENAAPAEARRRGDRESELRRPKGRARDVVAPEPVDDGSLGDNQAHLAAFAGVRTLFVAGGGYEPYATDGLLWHGSLGVLGVVYTDGPLSVALGGTWDIGSSHSRARGADTGISLQRLTFVPEARYHLGRRVAVYGRLGIGGAYLHATLEDIAGGVVRSADGLLFSADPGLGVAVQLGSTRSSQQSAPRVWLLVDGGYLFSSSTDLEFSSEDAPARSAPLRLGDMTLHGPYSRVSMALSF